MLDSLSSRAFPEVLVFQFQRAGLGALLVGVMGRFSRAPWRPKIYFFFNHFLFLLFLSIHFPVFVTFTVLLPPHDTRHPPPPYCTHVLPLSLLRGLLFVITDNPLYSIR